MRRRQNFLKPSEKVAGLYLTYFIGCKLFWEAARNYQMIY
jgi:hypothetical protein